YSFTGLGAGTYTVREYQPTGFDDGADYVGTVNGVTNGTQTVNDELSQITLADGDQGVNYNFTEILHIPVGSISGRVFLDLNQDGVLDTTAGDAALAGVQIELLKVDANGVLQNMGSTTTGDDGSYSFIGLTAGTYAIREFQPAAYGDGKDYVGT